MMYYVEKLYSFIYMAGYIFFERLFTRGKEKRSTGDGILIITTGFLGDALMLASAVRDIAQYYKNQGEHVTLLSNKKNVDIFKMFCAPVGIDVIQDYSVRIADGRYDYKTMLHTFISVQQWAKEHGLYKRTIAFSSMSPFSMRLAAAIPAKERNVIYFTATRPMSLKKKVHDILVHLWFDLIVHTPTSHNSEAVEKLERALGIPASHFEIMRLPKACEYTLPAAPYITVTVDSSLIQRRWPAENYIELIKKLTERYGLDIVLTGSSMPEEMAAKFAAAFSDMPNVINLVGKTSFAEFAEVIRGARFHIGVDSGSIHVAAAVGTVVFCLTGVWDYHKWFPYPESTKVDGTAVPVCIYRQDVDVDTLDCAGCNIRSGGCYGWGNKECLALCKAGQPCLCLTKITADDVMDAIEKTIKRVK